MQKMMEKLGFSIFPIPQSSILDKITVQKSEEVTNPEVNNFYKCFLAAERISP